MSRLTVKDLHTGKEKEVSEMSWNISLKNAKMPDGSGKNRYQPVKSKPFDPNAPKKKVKNDLSEADKEEVKEGGE